MQLISIEIKLIESAEIIDKEVNVLRKKVSKRSADLGDFVVVGISIKERISFNFYKSNFS